MVIGESLFWYRKRTLTVANDDLVEEVAGFPYVDLDEARLFTCSITWAVTRGKTQSPRAR